MNIQKRERERERQIQTARDITDRRHILIFQKLQERINKINEKRDRKKKTRGGKSFEYEN